MSTSQSKIPDVGDLVRVDQSWGVEHRHLNGRVGSVTSRLMIREEGRPEFPEFQVQIGDQNVRSRAVTPAPTPAGQVVSGPTITNVVNREDSQFVTVHKAVNRFLATAVLILAVLTLTFVWIVGTDIYRGVQDFGQSVEETVPADEWAPEGGWPTEACDYAPDGSLVCD